MSNTCFSKKKRCCYVLCPDLCTSFFHVSLGRYRSTLTAYDEQQRKSELTFITSAFPSKFFACKQAKCFHEFVVEVLPVKLQSLQFTIPYCYTTLLYVGSVWWVCVFTRIQVERLMTSVISFVIMVDWLRCKANSQMLLGRDDIILHEKRKRKGAWSLIAYRLIHYNRVSDLKAWSQS